jgi:metal-responsive CopG/Arc/MetJ family transcriptional regulator
MVKVERTSFSVSPELLNRFDDVVRRLGYEDRSRALQTAMTNFITEYTWAAERGGAVVVDVVVVVVRVVVVVVTLLPSEP